MIFVFDENLPPKLANVIKSLDEENGKIHAIHSVQDLEFKGVSDIELFGKLRDLSKDDKCVFISGDGMILKRKPEIDELKKQNLIAFICPPSVSQQKMFCRAVYLVNCWKSILSISETSLVKSVYKLPLKSFNLTENEIRRNQI